MFFRRLNWNVVGWFRTVSLISYLIIAAGLGSMVWHGFQGGNGFHANKMLQLGLAFTGGTEVDVKFTQPVTPEQVRKAFSSIGVTDLELRTVGQQNGNGWNTFSIEETQIAFGNDTPRLWSALNSVAPVDRSNSQITSVGPTLGGEYLRNAVYALIIALGIQFLYIAFRFGWNYIFGLVTVIALVRDAAMMIGIYALAGKKADDAFLAAVLTVIGYSVMDTIVILDRIRENTKLMAGQAYEKIVNTSILQTMTRSFNTLATVVITLVALLALGGASLKNFGFALLVGICSGGYHSIFFSAPLVLSFRKRQIEAAARKRAAGLGADRTRSARSVAEGKSIAAHGGAAREDIVAARRARRQKAKATRPEGSGPARYKRKRTSTNSATTVVDEASEYDAPEYFEEIDDTVQGHEEIHLNLEGFEPERPLPPTDEPEQPHNG